MLEGWFIFSEANIKDMTSAGAFFWNSQYSTQCSKSEFGNAMWFFNHKYLAGNRHTAPFQFSPVKIWMVFANSFFGENLFKDNMNLSSLIWSLFSRKWSNDSHTGDWCNSEVCEIKPGFAAAWPDARKMQKFIKPKKIEAAFRPPLFDKNLTFSKWSQYCPDISTSYLFRSLCWSQKARRSKYSPKILYQSLQAWLFAWYNRRFQHWWL